MYDNTKSLDAQNTSLPKLVVRSLKTLLASYCEQKEIDADDAKLQQAAERLIEWWAQTTNWGTTSAW